MAATERRCCPGRPPDRTALVGIDAVVAGSGHDQRAAHADARVGAAIVEIRDLDLADHGRGTPSNAWRAAEARGARRLTDPPGATHVRSRRSPRGSPAARPGHVPPPAWPPPHSVRGRAGACHPGRVFRMQPLGGRAGASRAIAAIVTAPGFSPDGARICAEGGVGTKGAPRKCRPDWTDQCARPACGLAPRRSQCRGSASPSRITRQTSRRSRSTRSRCVGGSMMVRRRWSRARPKLRFPRVRSLRVRGGQRSPQSATRRTGRRRVARRARSRAR